MWPFSLCFLVFFLTCQTLHFIFLAIIMYLCNICICVTCQILVNQRGWKVAAYQEHVSPKLFPPESGVQTTCPDPLAPFPDQGPYITTMETSTPPKVPSAENIYQKQERNSWFLMWWLNIKRLHTKFKLHLLCQFLWPSICQQDKVDMEEGGEYYYRKWKQSVYDPDPPPSRTWSKSPHLT